MKNKLACICTKIITTALMLCSLNAFADDFTEVASLRVYGASNITIFKNLAFILRYMEGDIKAYKIDPSSNDPEQKVESWCANVPHPTGIAIVDNKHLLITCHESIQMFEFDQSSNDPKQIKKSFKKIGEEVRKILGFVNMVVVGNKYVLLVNRCHSYIQIFEFDVSSGAIKKVGRFDTAVDYMAYFPDYIAMADDSHVLLGDCLGNAKIIGIYPSSNDPAKIVRDIRDIEQTKEFKAGICCSMTIVGKHVLMACGYSGVRIGRLNQLLTQIILVEGSREHVVSDMIDEITVDGNYMFVRDEHGYMKIIDMSKLFEPSRKLACLEGRHTQLCKLRDETVHDNEVCKDKTQAANKSFNGIFIYFDFCEAMENDGVQQ